MKKLLIIGIVFGVFFSSCRRDIYPDARFTVNHIEVQPEDDVLFTDLSIDAIEYYWDFGDGSSSTLRNPGHQFLEEGDFNVTLTVTSVDGRTDVTSLVIHVWYTVLDVTVVEWKPEEIITNDLLVRYAFVALYENEDDWLDDYNRVVWGTADINGEITFLGLDSYSYWVWVEADDVWDQGDRYDNYDFYLGNWYDYIITQAMIPFEINSWIAWVDYFAPGYKSATDNRRNKFDYEKIKADRRTLIKEEDVSE